jgi:hypothetical protein
MATGVTENEAKTDLCCAVADRKINVRVRIAATDRSMGGQFFSDGNVGVPRHLNPDDFDWTRSRPLRPWSIGPMLGQHYSWDWEDRPIDLIELSTADVREVLCGAGARGGALRKDTLENETGVPHAARSSPHHTRGQPARERAQIAIKALYPQGVPDPASEPNVLLCRKVGNWLKERSLPGVSDPTILRAAGRRI